MFQMGVFIAIAAIVVLGALAAALASVWTYVLREREGREKVSPFHILQRFHTAMKLDLWLFTSYADNNNAGQSTMLDAVYFRHWFTSFSLVFLMSDFCEHSNF